MASVKMYQVEVLSKTGIAGSRQIQASSIIIEKEGFYRFILHGKDAAFYPIASTIISAVFEEQPQENKPA